MPSQYEEDRYIREALGDRVGDFLDIGAYHPTVFSNTRALFERGWSGVMVEPSPEPFLTLLREYGNEPRIELVHAAVVARGHDLLRFHATADAVSTSDEGVFEKWRNTAAFTGSFLSGTVELGKLLRLGPFDFINFDSEGTSTGLFLAMLSLASIAGLPACVCVEYDDRLDDVRDYGAHYGYRETYLNGTNILLVRE